MAGTYIDGLDQEKVQHAIDRMLRSGRGQNYIDSVGGGDVRFGLFMRFVDLHMRKTLGITSGELADALWRDMYEDGMTPAEAAEEALRGDDLWSMLGLD